jgi:hypothetical protein
MRRIAYVPILAVAAAACARAAAPPATATATATAATATVTVTVPTVAEPVVAAAAPAPDGGAPCTSWIVRWARHEATHTVASCQVARIELASEVVADVRRTGPDRLTVLVTQDRETADNLPASPVLAGKSYVVTSASSGLDVRDGAGSATTDEEVLGRVRALASAVLPWSGSLQAGVESVVDMHVHGVKPLSLETSVQPGRGTTHSVTMRASQSDAGMCHTWATTTRLAGDLALRDGGLERLALHGPTATTEALCPEGARQAGASAAPRTCTEGEITLSVDVACAGPP